MANGINSPFGLLPYISNVGKADITKMMPYRIGYQIDEATKKITTLPYSIYSGDPVVFSGMYSNEAGNNKVFVGLNNEHSLPKNTAGSVVPLGAIPGIKNVEEGDNKCWGRANASIVGVGISAKYNNPNNIYNVEYPFWPASTAVNIDMQPIMYVNDDPQALFTVQCSTSTGNIEQAIFKWDMIGQNVALAVGGAAAFNPWNGLTATPNPATGNNLTGQSAYYADLSTIGDGTYDVVSSEENWFLNFKILGVVLPTNLNNVGNQNIINTAIIDKLTPGVDMPFMTVFGKINDHVYGMPTFGVQTA